MKKNLLILSASYWAWHNTAAQNIEKFYKEKWFNVKIIDLVDFVWFFWKQTQSFYQDFCTKYPNVWDVTYNILDKNIIKKIFFSIEYPYYQKNFDDLIKKINPNIVISVFPFWWWFIKNNIDNFWKKYKSWIIITDSISIHNIWYLKWNYIDKYFFIDDLSKEIFKKKFHHKTNNLITSFFPIEKKYFINKEFIDDNKIYFLLSWINYKYSNNLLKLLQNENFELNIIKWRNKEDYTKLKKDYKDIKNFNFIESIDLKENYKNIWIFIWKAWWATLSECIATNTPMIIPDFIPWQEEWNIELVKNLGLWIYEDNIEKTIFLLKYINWNKMIWNFNSTKKENSCEIIFNSLEN